MNKINKNDIDLDTTIVNIKFILKGSRNMRTVNCTASQCIEFTDYMNENRTVKLSRADKEKMENKYYIFDDIRNKKTVMVSLEDVRYMEIPFFIDNGEEYDIKILTIN